MTTKEKIKTVAVVLFVVVALVFIICWGWGDARRNTESEVTTTPSGGLLSTGPNNGPTAPTMPMVSTIPGPPTTLPPAITLGDNVTASIVPMQEGATPNRKPDWTAESPEYVAEDPESRYRDPNGFIYKNDRIVSIEYIDRRTSNLITVSFGVAQGTYNRFLYLNPVRYINGVASDSFFHFTTLRNNGEVVNFPYDYPSDKILLESTNSFAIRRCVDQRVSATYHSPSDPGTVWTAGGRRGQFRASLQILDNKGQICSILELVFCQDNDGCWYIANIENQDLTVCPTQKFSAAEAYKIFQMAQVDMFDGDKIGVYMTVSEKPLYEDFIIDYISPADQMYYEYFKPADPDAADYCLDYIGNPIIAVSLRQHSVNRTMTLYYYAVYNPTAEKDYDYFYIGRDYYQNRSIATLQGLGYPGLD